MGLENVRFQVDFSAVEPMDLGADAIRFCFRLILANLLLL
jgi:DNA repair protein RecN (Recombination protein N)